MPPISSMPTSTVMLPEKSLFLLVSAQRLVIPKLSLLLLAIIPTDNTFAPWLMMPVTWFLTGLS